MSKGLVSQWFSGLGCFSTPKCYECILLPNLPWRTGSITRRDCSTRQRCGQINNQLRGRHNKTGWNDFQEKSGERSQISWIEVQGQRQFRFQKYVKNTERCEISCLLIPTTSATEKIHINIQTGCAANKDSKKSTSHELTFLLLSLKTWPRLQRIKLPSRQLKLLWLFAFFLIWRLRTEMLCWATSDRNNWQTALTLRVGSSLGLYIVAPD